MGDRKRVIALGFFDGIHIGHAALLERTVQRAREIGATPSVLSFDIHPDTLVFGKEVPLINSAAGRADLIRRLFGIENVIFIHFDRNGHSLASDRINIRTAGLRIRIIEGRIFIIRGCLTHIDVGHLIAADFQDRSRLFIDDHYFFTCK